MPYRETNKPYHLLQPPVHSEHLYSMLGRVAAYQGRPQDKFAPLEPMRAKDITDNLYRRPVVARDVRRVISRATSAEATAGIKMVLSCHTSWGDTLAQSYIAPGFRRWDMVYPQLAFETLMKDARYANDVIRLLKDRDDKGAFFITGLLTCADMQVEEGRSSEMAMGSGAAVAPGSGSLAADFSRASRLEVEGTYEEEIIIAASYVKLKLVRSERGFLGWFNERDGNVSINENYLPRSEGIFMDEGPDPGNLGYIMGDGNPEEREGQEDEEGYAIALSL